MSQLITIDNFSENNIVDNTQLSADAAAAQAVLSVVDNSNFAANDFIIVGGPGIEGSEKAKVLSITGANIITATANLSLAHNRFDPLTKLFGDQIKVYRAANVDGTIPADGSFASIATVNLNYGENTTQYTDATGSNGFWYKYTYFNSVSSAETNLADSDAERGGGYDAYCAVDEIRQEAGLQNNEFITDAMIDTKRYEAQYEVDSALQGLYTVPFQPPINPRIREITVKLAAGKILSQDYGPMASGNSKSGNDKLIEARAMLKRIDDKQDILTDVNGGELIIAGAGGIQSWPDSTTDSATADNGGSERVFRMGDRF